jgi:hypothetical protein
MGTLRVDPPGPAGSFTVSPDSLDGPDSTFSADRGDGFRWELEFERTDEGQRLLMTSANGVSVLEKE